MQSPLALVGSFLGGESLSLVTGILSSQRKWAISSALALFAGLIPNLVVPAVASNCVVTLQNATFTASSVPSGLCMVRVSASSGGAQFQVPAGVTSLAVVVIGGGGGGGAGKGNSWGGGGGGGAGQLSVNPQLEVTPGQAVALTVGAGGTGGRSFGNEPITSGLNGTASIFGTVSVVGGIGGLTNASCAGGNGGGPSATTVNGAQSTFNAGSGAFGSCNPGGGGGGGAGSGGAGSAGSGRTEGTGGVGFVEQFSGNQIVLGVGGQGGNSNRNIDGHNLSSLVMSSPGGGGTGSDGGVNAVARGAPGAPGQIIIFFSPVLSVTYSSNGSAGTAPVDSNTYAVGGSATILSAGSLSRDGYEFVEWTTAASGGSAFSSGATVTLAGSLSLFARWSTRSFTIDYDPAAGGEHQGAIPSQVSALFSSLHTVQSTNLTRPGYQLQGWVVAGGNQNQLLTASNTVVLGAAPLVLSAVWAANQYTISFQVEGGSLISPSSYQMGAPIASPSQSSRAGFVFGGWAISANGQPISFPFTRGTPGDFELFALWSELPEAPASAPVGPIPFSQAQMDPGVSYAGPVVSGIAKRIMSSNGSEGMVLRGSRLHLITVVTVDGMPGIEDFTLIDGFPFTDFKKQRGIRFAEPIAPGTHEVVLTTKGHGTVRLKVTFYPTFYNFGN